MCGIQLKQCLEKKRRQCIVLNMCIRRVWKLIVHLKRLEKEKKSNKKIKRKGHIDQNATV